MGEYVCMYEIYLFIHEYKYTHFIDEEVETMRSSGVGQFDSPEIKVLTFERQ